MNVYRLTITQRIYSTHLLIASTHHIYSSHLFIGDLDQLQGRICTESVESTLSKTAMQSAIRTLGALHCVLVHYWIDGPAGRAPPMTVSRVSDWARAGSRRLSEGLEAPCHRGPRSPACRWTQCGREPGAPDRTVPAAPGRTVPYAGDSLGPGPGPLTPPGPPPGYRAFELQNGCHAGLAPRGGRPAGAPWRRAAGRPAAPEVTVSRSRYRVRPFNGSPP